MNTLCWSGKERLNNESKKKERRHRIRQTASLEFAPQTSQTLTPELTKVGGWFLLRLGLKLLKLVARDRHAERALLVVFPMCRVAAPPLLTRPLLPCHSPLKCSQWGETDQNYYVRSAEQFVFWYCPILRLVLVSPLSRIKLSISSVWEYRFCGTLCCCVTQTNLNYCWKSLKVRWFVDKE